MRISFSRISLALAVLGLVLAPNHVLLEHGHADASPRVFAEGHAHPHGHAHSHGHEHSDPGDSPTPHSRHDCPTCFLTQNGASVEFHTDLACFDAPVDRETIAPPVDIPASREPAPAWLPRGPPLSC